MGLDLIVAVRFGSGGYRQRETRAAAGLAGGALPRWRTTGESILGAAGLRLGWGLSVEDARGTCSPPEVRIVSGEVRSRSSAAMAALDGETSPEQAVR